MIPESPVVVTPPLTPQRCRLGLGVGHEIEVGGKLRKQGGIQIEAGAREARPRGIQQIG